MPIDIDEFVKTSDNAILDASDKVMMDFAHDELNYKHNKGLDFVARFNGKYVIGEAKFLTDFGGHQNAQFNDTTSTVEAKQVKAEKIVILDAVLPKKYYKKIYVDFQKSYKCYNVMNVLVLREFLYQI